MSDKKEMIPRDSELFSALNSVGLIADANEVEPTYIPPNYEAVAESTVPNILTGPKPKKRTKEEKEQRKADMHAALQSASLGLGATGAGEIPGAFVDAFDALLYLSEGKWKDAGMSAAAILPFLGFATHGKRVLKYADEFGDAGGGAAKYDKLDDMNRQADEILDDTVEKIKKRNTEDLENIRRSKNKNVDLDVDTPDPDIVPKTKSSKGKQTRELMDQISELNPEGEWITTSTGPRFNLPYNKNLDPGFWSRRGQNISDATTWLGDKTVFNKNWYWSYPWRAATIGGTGYGVKKGWDYLTYPNRDIGDSFADDEGVIQYDGAVLQSIQRAEERKRKNK
tara:strand:+ start:213 stop:1229 length:1017 start_codon:yes stop_codon:yes gene_type:complete